MYIHTCVLKMKPKQLISALRAFASERSTALVSFQKGVVSNIYLNYTPTQ